MFSVYHIVWLMICAGLCVGSLLWLHRTRPPLKRVLFWASMGGILSEVVKTFGAIEMVPSSDGSDMHPYLEMQHLPLHLCSLQIVFIFYTCFAKDGKLKEILLAFMYPSCTVGAFCALLIPSIVSSGTVPEERLFLHPIGYQYFLVHAMLIILGLYIPMSDGIQLKPKHFGTTLATLGVLGFVSLYLNSIFASPVYENGKLISVDYVANFFFTYNTPIGIELTELWHWYLYFGIILAIAVFAVTVFYIPVFLRAKQR